MVRYTNVQGSVGNVGQTRIEEQLKSLDKRIIKNLMEQDLKEISKKYILWTYSDYGWHPQGFDTLKHALTAERYTSIYFITNGKIDFDVNEI